MVGWSNLGGWRSGGWNRAAGGGGSGLATWDAAFKNADILLSGGNLIATTQTDPDTYENVLATNGRAAGSGKFYFEVTFSRSPPAADSQMGLAIATRSAALNFWPGSSGAGTNASVSWIATLVRLNSTTLATVDDITDSTLLACACDLVNMKLWVKAGSGTWNAASADPTNPATGIDISGLATGPYYPLGYLGNTSESVTANFGQSSYTYLPSGYVNW